MAQQTWRNLRIWKRTSPLGLAPKSHPTDHRDPTKLESPTKEMRQAVQMLAGRKPIKPSASSFSSLNISGLLFHTLSQDQSRYRWTQPAQPPDFGGPRAEAAFGLTSSPVRWHGRPGWHLGMGKRGPKGGSVHLRSSQIGCCWWMFTPQIKICFLPGFGKNPPRVMIIIMIIWWYITIPLYFPLMIEDHGFCSAIKISTDPSRLRQTWFANEQAPFGDAQGLG